MNFLKGFQAAFRGVVHCINHERNMRIHTVAALYVFVFSFFFHISAAGYGVLFTVFGLMLALEVINTGLEALADRISAGYSPVVKVVKDIAAGAVLVMAVFAVAVAVVLFWQPEGFVRIYRYFCVEMPVMWLPFIVGSGLCLWYIAKGPLGIKNFFLRHKKFREK